jgi:hypothetical protein
MDVIESGLEGIRGGAGCPCICSKATGTFLRHDTDALSSGACGCGCSCLYIDNFDNNIANQTMAYGHH